MRILPTRWRRKPAGVDMERNYVTVSLCMSKSTTDIHVWLQAFLTPLLLAARFSSAELVRRLLLAGADIDNCTRVLEIELCLHISHSITCYKTAAAIFMNVEVHMCALRLTVCVCFLSEKWKLWDFWHPNILSTLQFCIRSCKSLIDFFTTFHWWIESVSTHVYVWENSIRSYYIK